MSVSARVCRFSLYSLYLVPGPEELSKMEMMTSRPPGSMATPAAPFSSCNSPRTYKNLKSGRYTFALDEQPTDIVVDEDGVRSFYTYDVNGLEFEFTFLPSGMS